MKKTTRTRRDLTAAKVPVSMRALEQRVSRFLRKDGHELNKTRGLRAQREIGEYFIVDEEGVITQHHVNLPRLARQYELLQPFETVYTDKETT